MKAQTVDGFNVAFGFCCVTHERLRQKDEHRQKRCPADAGEAAGGEQDHRHDDGGDHDQRPQSTRVDLSDVGAQLGGEFGLRCVCCRRAGGVDVAQNQGGNRGQDKENRPDLRCQKRCRPRWVEFDVTVCFAVSLERVCTRSGRCCGLSSQCCRSRCLPSGRCLAGRSFFRRELFGFLFCPARSRTATALRFRPRQDEHHEDDGADDHHAGRLEEEFGDRQADAAQRTRVPDEHGIRGAGVDERPGPESGADDREERNGQTAGEHGS